MAKFSDKAAARQLRNRLAREIAAYAVQSDGGSAEDLAKETAWAWLESVADEENPTSDEMEG